MRANFQAQDDDRAHDMAAPNANFSHSKFAHTRTTFAGRESDQGQVWTCKGKVVGGEGPVLALS